jgi:hypothetical protein
MKKTFILFSLLSLLILLPGCVICQSIHDILFPPVTEPPDFGVSYAGWVDLLVTNYSSQDVGVKYYLFVVDKDKSNIYTVSSSSWVVRANSDKWLVYNTIGLDASYHGSYPGILLRDEFIPYTDLPLTNIRKTLIDNNVTNLMISFLLEVTKGSSKIVFTGFDSSITNITNLNANVYGLGYFDGAFDGWNTITNVTRIVPVVSNTNTYYIELLRCSLDVNNDSAKVSLMVVYYGEIVTNTPF